MVLSDGQVLAIKRKRGELGLPVVGLANQIGVSRWTLDRVLKDNHRKVTPSTYKKLTDWLIDEYTNSDIANDKQAVVKK